MKRMNKLEIDLKADNLVRKYICGCGLRNANKIVWQAYKTLRAELKKRKENKNV